MNFFKMSLLFIFAIVCFVAVSAVFAADATGSAGTSIVDALAKLLGDNTTAMSLYTLLIGIVGIVVRVLLKRVPTVARGVVGKIVWSILAGLFGDGVVLSNAKDQEQLKEALKKKYPLLNIEIKK